MKKTGNIIYVLLGLLICILPSAGMLFYRTDTTTENKVLASFPQVFHEEKLNKEYFNELSAYFEDHFAFRRELVSADAQLMSKVFQVSNVDTVICGTDGWLYYSDTKNDYLGIDTLNERQVFNIVNNLSQLQTYVENHGAQFVFTVAPNKNSLYGTHMPYYDQYKVSDISNIDLLLPQMQQQALNYVDLFEVFKQQEEVLYLKRDSHWNNKGAVLAYNTIMDSLFMEQERFDAVPVTRTRTEYGDLNRMLYPLSAVLEWNYDYADARPWTYVSQNHEVEDAWLETACADVDEDTSLLMFRDSFGNTLLPLLAQQFSDGIFSKETAYRIGTYMQQYEPKYVIVEKVERNLDEYMQTPPVMQGAQTKLAEHIGKGKVPQANIQLKESGTDTGYWELSGSLLETPEDTASRIFIRLTTDTSDLCYEAFTTVNENSDYGYLLYVPKNKLFADTPVDVEILTGNEQEMVLVEQAALNQQ